MENWVLARSFDQPNIQCNLWYVMEESDLDDLKAERTIGFGDKAYCITEMTYWIMGNNDTWYPMQESEK